MTIKPRPIVAADWADPYDFSARREWIKLCFLLLITAIAYTPVFSAGFLWRDDQTILSNESIRSLRAAGHTWLHPRSVPLYRPLADTLFALEYKIWGSWNPTGYHIISLILHLLATMLVWRVLVRLEVPAALVGAGLFALHPVAVHTVAWASQQPVLLASVFALLALLGWLRWREREELMDPNDAARWQRHRLLIAIATIALFAASLLSDLPTAAMLPLAMWVIQVWKRRQPVEPGAKRGIVILEAMSVVISIVFILARPANVDSWSAGLAWQALPRAIVKLIVPYPLLLTYSPIRAQPWLLLSYLFVPALLVAGWMLRRRTPRAITAMAIFLLMLYVPAGLNDVISDSQQYLARAALLSLIAAAVAPLIPEQEEGDDARHRFTRPLVAMLLLVVLAGGTWWQATLCRSNATAWAHVLAHEPDSRIARLELANDALARRETGAAIDQLQQLVARDDSNADAHLRLGEVLMDQGSVDEAIAHFEKAAKLRPDDPSVWRHRGAAAMRKDDLSAAAAYYQRALSLDPRDDIAQNNLATLYVRQGQIDRAIDAYTKLVKDNPRNAVAHINLARLLFDTGKPSESAEHLKQAVAIDPANFDAYLTAGDVLMKLKDFHQAQRMFQQAVRLKRENAPALNALGVSYAAQGLWNEAVYQFGRALDVDPNYEPAKKNLDSARRDRDAAAAQPH